MCRQTSKWLACTRIDGISKPISSSIEKVCRFFNEIYIAYYDDAVNQRLLLFETHGHLQSFTSPEVISQVEHHYHGTSSAAFQKHRMPEQKPRTLPYPESFSHS